MLLDGLDEVEVEHREACVKAINHFTRVYGRTEIVVSCRLEEYEALQSNLQLRVAVYIKPLTLDQVDKYLDSFGPGMAATKALLREDEVLQELVKSPLMLGVMTVAYKDKKADELPKAGSLQEYRQKLFDEYINRMFIFKGKTRTSGIQYAEDKARHWLSWLAGRMQSESQTVFLIEEIQPSLLVNTVQRNLYRIGVGLIVGMVFGFLAGLYLIYYQKLVEKELSVHNDHFFLLNTSMIFGLIYGLFSGLLIVPPSGPKLALMSGRLMRTIMSGSMFAIPFALFVFYVLKMPRGYAMPPIFLSLIFSGAIFGLIDQEIKPVKIIKLDFLKVLRFSVISAVGLGVPYVLLRYISLPEIYGKKGFQYMGFELLVFVIAGGIYGGFKIPTKKKANTKGATPNQGIMDSVKYSAISFAILAPLSALCGWTFDRIFSPFYLLCLGLTVGLLGALGANQASGIVCIQHFTLRIILYLSGNAPWNYARFLDFATEHIFMKKIGGGYMFFHRMLMEHFSQIELPSGRRDAS